MEYKKEYNKNNKEKIRNYKVNNIERIRKYDRKYEKQRRKEDPSFRLRKMVSRSINDALKANNSSKNGKSIKKYLPYTIEELRQYLESKFEPWMNWSNQGVYVLDKWNDNDLLTWKWQIDHIIPQSSLPYASMEDENFKKCWALENLRPLSAKENLLKGNKII